MSDKQDYEIILSEDVHIKTHERINVSTGRESVETQSFNVKTSVMASDLNLHDAVEQPNGTIIAQNANGAYEAYTKQRLEKMALEKIAKDLSFDKVARSKDSGDLFGMKGEEIEHLTAHKISEAYAELENASKEMTAMKKELGIAQRVVPNKEDWVTQIKEGQKEAEAAIGPMIK
jgi:hypothetical protein